MHGDTAQPKARSLADLFSPIVRSCGERTTQRAVGLLTRVFPNSSIDIIREVPFENALRATYETAIANGREWAFVMDADVLPSPQRLRDALALSKTRDADVFVFRGLVLDKFFGWPREVGNYIYRTEHLKKALDLIPKPGAQLRPEFFTIKAMHDLGHRMETVKGMTYAVHDFEQFFRDVFRKGFVYAGKHPAIEILMTDWEKKAETDADFRVMLAGAIASRSYGGRVEIDIRCFPRDLNSLLSAIGLTEKDPLTEPEVPTEQVNALIDSWIPSPVYHAYHAFLGVWPQRMSELSLGRLRALIGWMRQSRARGSLGAELHYLMRASFGRRKKYGDFEVQLGKPFTGGGRQEKAPSR